MPNQTYPWPVHVKISDGPYAHKMLGNLRIGRTICGLFVSKSNSIEVAEGIECPACAENRHYRDIGEMGIA